MQSLAPHQNGYMDATRSVGMPREVEYQLFSKITGKMNQCADDRARFNTLVEALTENLSMWQTIALSVADENNELPPPLRAQLFYLYEFVQHHTPRVLRREADAAPLIEINTSIMRGLRGVTLREVKG